MKILVVDDSQVTRGLIIAHIEDIPEHTFTTIEATNGREAIKLYQEEEPDVVLLDYLLPDMTGVEVVEELLKYNSILPIVMVTGFDDVQLAVDSMDLGVQGYLLKDRVSADTLLWSIEDAIRKVTMKKRITAYQKELEGFSTTVAHELKDQIGSLQGILGLISKKESKTKEEERLVKMASKAADHMQNFVNDLLSYAILQKDSTKKESFPLNELTNEVKLKLEYLIDKTGAKINHHKLPKVYGSYALILEVMKNIMESAILYAGDNPEISIEANDNDNNWQICIANGKGMSDKNKEKILDIFEKGLSSSEIYNGGISLAICKRIVEDIHNGKIWVESGKNKDSSFCFVLPKEKRA